MIQNMFKLDTCPICDGTMSIALHSDDDHLYWWAIQRGIDDSTACTCRLFMESSSKFSLDDETKPECDPIAVKLLKELVGRWNSRSAKTPLPVDTYGIPIHIGDKLEYTGNSAKGTVMAINSRMIVVLPEDSHHENYAKYGLLWDSEDCINISYQSIENVLTDFAYRVCDRSVDRSEIVRFADKIRELVNQD